MYKDLYFYVDLDCEQYIDNPNYLSDLYKIVTIAYQHKATVFFSEEQITEIRSYFLEDDWNKELNHSHNTHLRNLLKSSVKKNSYNNYCFQVCFATENTSLHPIRNNAVSMISRFTNTALISFSYTGSNTLLLVKSATEFEKINFDIIKNKNELLTWVQKLKLRIFNLSPKHGENGKENWKGESVLLCNRSDAQTLLNTAIPDFIEKENRLFNFDEKHKTFIEFFYEGDNPQKQWHGFHVNLEEWDKRIPERIRKYFNK